MSTDLPPDRPPADDAPDERIPLKFHWLKSEQFRTVFADGIFGGGTPRGNLHVAFFVERSPIPTVTVEEIVGGKLAGEVRDKRIARDGMVRELQVDVVMTLHTAKAFQVWLTEHVAQLEAAMGEPARASGEAS